ncbi:MAG: PSD1 and planctomycete cytochrome C domain-containing protein [Gemmataceae bacterium]|nr:PSD1 and planctomycete cytochrome C domain-containing protein [Gemmataceae bacterium]
MRKAIVTGAVAVVLLACPPVRADGPEPTGAGLDFFEKKVRPVLAEHCYKCHSTQAKSPKGGLLLDSRAGLNKGGDSGPAVVAGKPAQSLLIKAVRHVDLDLRMPPDGKLPAPVLADLEKWVLMGAPMPKDRGPSTTASINFATARKHWAYQPVRKPPLPIVKDRTWPTSPVDHFILAKLEGAGLTPSPLADRRTLIRRAYFDLIGLPPTFEEIRAFEQDRSPDAYEKVIDRLLASPHYGERWGRHWLDVARYADTKDGVLMYGDDRIRPYAYTYRDYVIKALNSDTPYDRFIHEQLAADLLYPPQPPPARGGPGGGEPWRLGGMGLLTLGRMFDDNIHDVLDDRIDTVTRGLLGLTVSCARCHDHKYDAVPTADYYALYGVFASSEAPLDRPLIEQPEPTPGFVEFDKKYNAKRQEMQNFLDKQFALLTETARQRVGDYLVHVATRPPDLAETAIYFLSLAPTDLRPQIVNRWRKLLDRRARPDDPVFGPWHDLMRLEEARLASEAPAVVERWQGRPAGTETGRVNPLVRDALAAAQLKTRADVARAYDRLLRKVYEEAKKASASGGRKPPDERQDQGAYAPRSPGLRPPLAAQRQLLELVSGRDSPGYFPKGHTWQYMSRGEKDNFSRMKTELDRLAVKSPHAPARAMVLHDGEIHDPRVFVRGNPAAPGERVPRQFLRILAGDERRPFPNGSGRLDLARAIAAPDNPLTARVLVNRVWMHHFGEPLVATPSDFGARSTPPTHPELLDYLASTFMDNGWALKKLHRHIMLSSAYRQASWDRPECRKVDPDNRLLWRANRRRLDLEAMRDSLLFVSGRLETRMHGRPVDIVGDSANRRRTVYGLVDRQSLPGLFRAFDFASPDTTVERRPFTTVPQQALFALNAPFMVEQARALVTRLDALPSTDVRERVAHLYRLALARSPADSEMEAALRFLGQPRESAGSQLTPWQQLAQVLLMTNEFLFVD